MHVPFAAAGLDAPPVLPLRPTGADWLSLVVALPLAGALVNALFGARLGPRGSRAVTIATAAGSLSLLVTALVQLAASVPDRRLLVDRLWTFAESGALRVDLAFAVGPLPAALAVAVAACALLVSIAAAPGTSHRIHGAHALLTGASLVALCADDLLIVIAGLEGLGLAMFALANAYAIAEKTATAIKPLVVGRLGTAAMLLGGVLLFWSAGASGWSPEHRLQKDVALARLVGVPAAYETGARRAEPAPVGVDEARARGDARAQGAAWIVPGPTFSIRTLRELVSVRSTDFGDRLASMSYGDLPVLGLACLLLLVGAAAFAAQAPLHAWLTGLQRASPGTLALVAVACGAAGLGLFARLEFLYALAPGARSVTMLVGASTALAGAWSSTRSDDLVGVHVRAAIAQLGLAFLGIAAFPAAGVAHALALATFVPLGLLACEAFAARATGTIPFAKPASVCLRPAQFAHLYASIAGAGLVLAGGFLTRAAVFDAALGQGGWHSTLAAIAVTPASALLGYALWRAHVLAFSTPADAAPPDASPARLRIALASFALLAFGTLALWLPWGAPLLARFAGTAAPGRVGLAALVLPLLASMGGAALAHARRKSLQPGRARVRVPRSDAAYVLVATTIRMFANFAAALDRFVIDGLSGAAVLAFDSLVERVRRRPNGGGR